MGWAELGLARRQVRSCPFLFFIYFTESKNKCLGIQGVLQNFESWSIKCLAIFLATKKWFGQIWIINEIFKK